MRVVAIIVGALSTLGVWGDARAVENYTPSLEVAEAVRPLVSGERVRVKKLARDIESAMDTLNQGGVAPFQDSAYVQKWRAAVERFRAALGKYPQIDDPDVEAAAAKLAELENMLAFGISESAKQKAELGDVQAILAGIENDLRANPAPQWLPPPFTDSEVQRWVTLAATAKQTAQRSAEELKRLAPVAHLPLNRGTVQSGAPYDRHDLDRLFASANGIIRDVDEAVQKTVDTLKARFAAQDQELDYYRELDPDNQADRMNAFLREGAEAEIYAGLDSHLALANSVVAYQRAFGTDPSPSTTARVEEVAALRAAYAAKRMEAIGNSSLPEPESTDPERIAIARDIMANPDYAFGEHGPIVLTTPDIVERQKQVSRAEVKDVDVSLSGTITLSGTETSWNYRWEEFKFATPIKEPESGDWYIWWITAKKFASGWEGTPIGRWVSGGATKGDVILEENF